MGPSLIDTVRRLCNVSVRDFSPLSSTGYFLKIVPFLPGPSERDPFEIQFINSKEQEFHYFPPKFWM